ncbi:MAG: hypothetical protein AAGA75_10250 [Cyanobacteria bacterium P01_E01_bin.6]
MGVQHDSIVSSLQPSLKSLSKLGQYTSAVLMSRDLYKSCHIEAPDLISLLPAICVDNCFYSLFKVEQERTSALETLKRLHERGDTTVVTVIPKGYAIWILEPEAIAVKKVLNDGSDSIQDDDSNGSLSALDHHPKQSYDDSIPYQILTSQRQYTAGKALIRGLDRPVPVVYFQGHYYSLFKTIHDIKQTAHIVKQISGRGKRIVVTRKDQGYGIWILEAHAEPMDA